MTRFIHGLLALGVLLSAAVACADDERLVFEAESPEFDAATEEYRQIWAEEGARIVATLERYSGLEFEPGPIQVIVHEGVSFSGYKDERPMLMRASYPPETKRATLVHELSHRILVGTVPIEVEDHPLIFLFLYDVWVDLWGEELAQGQVAVESRRRGPNDYAGNWKKALAMTAEERASKWQAYLADVEN